MAIILKINNFLRKKYNSLSLLEVKNLKIRALNPLFLITFLITFSGLFFISLNLIYNKNIENEKNLKEITQTNEFTNLSNFFISKIISPYQEISYVIQKKDTVEKILRKFKINENDIKIISSKLKQKKLVNIYSGRKLNLIIKKEISGSYTLVNFIYPVNNTSSIEVRKSQDNFIVNENILQLYKKEIVVKSLIKNNLYSSAINANVEANIIVEFARIFGFEVDFQRDIRKGDWFEILYEKLVDENNKVRDTGKIIYASMFVNGEEINLYNFKFNNEEDYYDIKGKSITKSLMKTL